MCVSFSVVAGVCVFQFFPLCSGVGGVKLKGKWFFVCGTALAVLAALSAYSYLSGLEQRVAVVVAARDLQRWEWIAPADVVVRLLHPDAVHADSIRTPAQVVGRQVTQAILQGEQVRGARTDLSPGLCQVYGLGPAQRAMFIPGGFQRCAGGVLRTGDLVDLVCVIANRDEPIAYRLATGLEVLEVRDDRGRAWSGQDDRQMVGGVLLAVSDGEAEAIALAISCGHVYLLLSPEEPFRAPAGGEPQ